MKHIVGIMCCLAATLMLSTACSEEETGNYSDIAMIVRPSAGDSIVLESGEKQVFSLDYYTNTGGYVNHMQVKSVDAEHGEQILHDTLYAESTDETTYMYVAPQTAKENLRVKLTFTAWETTGKKTSQIRYVNIKSKQLLMNELGPIVLYMATDKDDAICFDSPTQTFCHAYTAGAGEESRKSDLYLAVDTINVATNEYRLSFASTTGTQFVRSNSLDYASASALAVQTVFDNSVRSAKIEDLGINDIVIVGHQAKAEGILFVQNIVRQGMSNELCLQLRYKPITNQ